MGFENLFSQFFSAAFLFVFMTQLVFSRKGELTLNLINLKLKLVTRRLTRCSLLAYFCRCDYRLVPVEIALVDVLRCFFQALVIIVIIIEA